MRNTQKPPRPKKKKKNIAVSKILMAPAPLGPPRKKKTKLGPMSPRPTGRPKVPGGPPGTRPKTGPRAKPTPKFKFDIPTRDKFKKMANGGDLAKMFKTSGRISDKDKVNANKAIMDFVKKIKPTGRPSDLDVQRAINAFKMARKGQKPVLDSKGKPVKGLTQKAGPGKPMSPEQKKQIQRFTNISKRMPKSPPKRQIRKAADTANLKSAARGAMRGMRKPAGKMMRAAARRMKKTI
jgi:hypothetical protein